MLKLKLQYFGHLMRRTDSLEKTLKGRDWGQEEKGMAEDEMAEWRQRLDGHEFEETLGVGDGQGGLVCCGSLGCKDLDTTEWLNWNELNTNPKHKSKSDTDVKNRRFDSVGAGEGVMNWQNSTETCILPYVK